jgi:hypothetical protein
MSYTTNSPTTEETAAMLAGLPYITNAEQHLAINAAIINWHDYLDGSYPHSKDTLVGYTTAITQRYDDQIRTLQNMYVLKQEELDAKVNGLHATIETMETTARENLRIATSRHRDDITRISEIMMEAAEDNNLCGVYDHTVAKINANMFFPLEERSREYVVTFTATVTFTTLVNAQSPDEAAENAENDLPSSVSDMLNTRYMGNFTAQDVSYNDFEAELN